MQFKYLVVGMWVAVALLLSSSRVGADSLSVELTVQGEDSSLVRSYFARELRKLGDVVVTDYKPSRRLHVLAGKLALKAKGTSVGYALAVIATWSGDAFYETAKNHLVCEADTIWINFRGEEVGEKHFLRICGKDGLEGSCAELVAQFDTGVLDPVRAARTAPEGQIRMSLPRWVAAGVVRP